MLRVAIFTLEEGKRYGVIQALLEGMMSNKEAARNTNDCWSMDFSTDSLFNGKQFRALTLEIFSSECLGIEVDQGIKGDDVANFLDFIRPVHGIPKMI